MNCNQCGNHNPDGARFCSVCGSPLKPAKQPRKASPAVIILSVALAVTLIILGVVLLNKPGNDYHEIVEATVAAATEPAIVKVPESGPVMTAPAETEHIHVWMDATCQAPKTCMLCGDTDGISLMHDWQIATCYAPMTCALCGETSGEPLEHLWMDATSVSPKTCLLCGLTEGEPIASNRIDYVDGDWKSQSLKDGNNTYSVHAFVFNEKLVNVKEFTVNMNVSMKAGTKCEKWQVWGKVGSSFEKIAKITLPGGDGETSKTIKLKSPKTISAIAITPTVSGGYSWSMGMSITDVLLAD